MIVEVDSSEARGVSDMFVIIPAIVVSLTNESNVFVLVFWS